MPQCETMVRCMARCRRVADHRVSLAPEHLLAGIIAAWPGGFGGLDALSVSFPPLAQWLSYDRTTINGRTASNSKLTQLPHGSPNVPSCSPDWSPWPHV